MGMGAPQNRQPSGSGNPNEPSSAPPTDQPQVDVNKQGDGGEPPKENVDDEGKQPIPQMPNEPDALAALRAENQKLVRESAEARAFGQSLVAQLQAAAADAGQGDAVSFAERLNENPEAVLSEFFNRRTQPIVNGYMQQQANLAREIFEERSKADEDFMDFRPQLEQFMKDIPLESKLTPTAWEKAFRFVLADKGNLEKVIEKRIKRRQTSDRRAFVEPGSPAGPNGVGKPVLTEDMRAIAKGLGMSEDEYVQWMK